MEYASAIWSGENTTKLPELQARFCRRHEVSLPPVEKRFRYHMLVSFFTTKNLLIICPNFCLSLSVKLRLITYEKAIIVSLLSKNLHNIILFSPRSYHTVEQFASITICYFVSDYL